MNNQTEQLDESKTLVRNLVAALELVVSPQGRYKKLTKQELDYVLLVSTEAHKYISEEK
jgi:hypothetical protein